MTAVLRTGVLMKLRQFRSCASGVAVIEFAALAPLMLLLALGTFEIGRAVVIHKRFQRAVAMVGDLIARETVLSSTTAANAQAQLDGIMRSGEQVMFPYSKTPLKIGVMQVLASSDTDTTVQWSYKYNGGSASACGATKAQPTSGMVITNNYAIVVEAEYQYTPVLKDILPFVWTNEPFKEVVANATRDICVHWIGNACKAC